MAVYPNNRYASASPYRQIGGAMPGFEALQSPHTARKNRFSNATWSGITGGDRATGLLPLTPGAIASTQSNGIGLTVPPAPISRGVNLTALPVTLGVTPDSAPLQLKTFTGGTVVATLSSVVPQLSQLVAITGITNPICTVAAAPAQATGTLTITPSTIMLSMAAQLSATGWLSGAISPYTPLSPESLAEKIEQTLSPRLDDIEQKVGITLALAAAG
jgi:hypothetical protein